MSRISQETKSKQTRVLLTKKELKAIENTAMQPKTHHNSLLSAHPVKEVLAHSA